jgi:tRNA dimethylallyltransferase
MVTVLRVQRVVVVTGPTASGKSDLAVALAQRLGGEVVNADSMQVYRGMDIGTAKLAADERGGVRHHLIDLLDVLDTASVAEFQGWARNAVDDCHARGVVPIVVGGSSLYIRAVVDDLEFPGTDPRVRARWEARLAEMGPEALHLELAWLEPEAAKQILPSNTRRVVRALEVIELTGSFKASLPPYESIYDDVTLIGLDVPRDVLDERIIRRVEVMWEAGLVDEVRGLLPRGLAEGLTAPKAIGYQQALDFVRHDVTAEEARAAIVVATRKFARRQDRMFRQDPRINWLRFDSPTLVEDALALVRLRRT